METPIKHGFPSEEDWLAWKKRRRNTIIGFVMVGTVSGIDASVVSNTLYLYLKDLIHTKNPQLWYGIILATFFTAASIFGGISGRFVDKTRRVRLYINFSLLIQAVGFIIYAIPYSPYNLLLGRFLCGIGEPFMSVVAGEVLRIYGGDESNQAMIWLGSTFTIGFIIGPCLSVIFVSVHFHIGWMKVTMLNFVSIFMTFCLLGIAVLAYFLVSDCSAEFDLKEFLAQHEREKEIEEENEKEGVDETRSMLQSSFNEDKIISVKGLIYTLSRNIDALLILCSSFILMYTFIIAFVWAPLILLNILKYGVLGTSYFYLGFGAGGLVILMVLSTRRQSNTSVYYASIISIISNMLMFVIFYVMQVMARSYWADIVCVISLAVTIILSCFYEDVLSRVILGSMVPSEVQSFTESLRSGVARFGLLAGSFSSPFLYSHLPTACVVLMSIGFAILIMFLFRRKQLLDPKELKFDKTY